MGGGGYVGKNKKGWYLYQPFVTPTGLKPVTF